MKERKSYFLGKAISRELKKWKSGEIGDLSWLSSFPRDQTFWLVWEGISAKLDEELKKEGLWHRDGDSTVIPQENGIPSLKKRKSFSAESTENADESIYDPENLDEIYREERIAEEDDLEEEEAPPTDGEPCGDSLHPYLPRLSVSSSHLLMRRYPLDLRESLARDLFDSYSLLADRDLLPALCFFEVGINDPETFRHVWEEAYKDGAFHKGGKKFSFLEFQKDKLRLFHRLKREKERYFNRNPHLREKKAVATLWKRFEEAERSLTRKQWNVIKQVRVKKRSQTAVARDMRISLDSLRNRLEAAELKFRRALPELASFFPSTSFRENAKANFIYDGLFDRREKVAPLYRIDPKTGIKTEIPLRKGKIRQKPGVNAAIIKAWAHETTPVPDFSFTEFFTQLYPKGAIDRQSAGDNAPHDKATGSHTERSRIHKKRGASQDED